MSFVHIATRTSLCQLLYCLCDVAPMNSKLWTTFSMELKAVVWNISSSLLHVPKLNISSLWIQIWEWRFMFRPVVVLYMPCIVDNDVFDDGDYFLYAFAKLWNVTCRSTSIAAQHVKFSSGITIEIFDVDAVRDLIVRPLSGCWKCPSPWGPCRLCEIGENLKYKPYVYVRTVVMFAW